MIARVMFGESVSERLANGGEEFVTVGEPACGAGGMALAFAKVVIAAKRDPARAMWAQCQDVDRVAAMMCYLQLSIWNIPAVVIVGNTLTMEVREVFYTPAHRLGFWNAKLARRWSKETGVEPTTQTTVTTQVQPDATTTVETPSEEAAEASPTDNTSLSPAQTQRPLEPLATSQQVGFDFGL
jgi:hypothetical protein